MAEAARELKGAERAAILLLSIGEDDASEVLKHMDARDVQKVGSAMTALGTVSREHVDSVLTGFAEGVEQETALGVGIEDYIRKMLTSALGEDKAGSVIDRILLGNNTKGLDSLKWMEPRAIGELISQEHPQIIAIILAYLDADQAAEVLDFMPERIRADVMMRVASLDGIQPSALHELDDLMEKQFAGNNSKLKSSSVGGVKTAANILNAMDGARETDIMASIGKLDENLGQKIQDLMFVFDDLVDVEDRDMQIILREISSDQLVIALKGADAPIKDKIFNNMSKRAAEILADDLEVKGPVRLSEVDQAQKDVLAAARKLADSGAITLGGSGEEYV
jgi:flagellar motor switch protein FliG